MKQPREKKEPEEWWEKEFKGMENDPIECYEWKEIKDFIRSLLSSLHHQDCREFEKVIDDLIERYKQGKRKMYSGNHKLQNRFPEKAERIDEKIAKRSIQIDATIKAFERVLIALEKMKEEV